MVVNQIAYTVVVRLASSGTRRLGERDGTGYTIYSSAFLLVMAPHAIITVSLATAMLPRLSASRRRRATSPAWPRSLATTLRTALALIVPFALLLPVVAPGSPTWSGGTAPPRRRPRTSRPRWRCSRPGWSSSPCTT